MYIDPGYGALLVQGLFASLLGAVYIARQKIRSFLGKPTGTDSSPAIGSDNR